MKRLNKILLLFFTMVILGWYVAWQAIRSEKFAEIVSGRLTEILQEKVAAKVEFKNFELELFPPGILFNNVRLAKMHDVKSGISGSFVIKEIGVYFNILDFLENKVSIKELYFNDGIVEVENVVEKGATSLESLRLKEKVRKFIDAGKSDVQKDIDENPIPGVSTIRQMIDQISSVPVRSVVLDNILVNLDGDNLKIGNLSIVEKRSSFRISVGIENPSMVIIPQKYQNVIVDGFKFDVELLEDILQLDLLEIYSQTMKLEAHGIVSDRLKNFGNWKYDIDYKLVGGLGDFSDRFIGRKYVQVKTGAFEVNGNANGIGEKINATASLLVKNFDTEYVAGDSLEVAGKLSDGVFEISKLELVDNWQGNGKLDVAKPFVLYDSRNSLILPDSTMATFHNFHTNRMLKAIDTILNPLKGRIDGDVEIAFQNNKIYFSPQKGTTVRQMKLQFAPDDPSIIASEYFTFQKGYFSFDVDSLDVEILIDISLANSSYSISGIVAQEGDKIFFNMKDSKVDMVDLGMIAGVDIKGVGTAELTIDKFDGKYGLLIDGSFKDFQVLGFSLGEIKTKVLVGFEDIVVSIKELNGSYENSVFSGFGKVDVEHEPNLDLSVSFSQGSLDDLSGIYAPIISELKSYPKSLGGSFQHKFHLTGGFGVDLIKVQGSFSGENLSFYEEVFSKIRGTFSFSKNQLDVKKIFLQKGKGVLTGGISVNIENQFVDFATRIAGLELKEIAFYHRLPLGIQGTLYGALAGKGIWGALDAEGDLTLKESHIYETAVKDSSIHLESKNRIVDFELKYMGDVMSASGYLDFTQKKNDVEKRSSVSVDLNVTELSMVVASLMGHYFKQNSISGKIQMNGYTEFNVENISKMNLVADVEDFLFKRKDINMSLDHTLNKIRINNGKIDLWNILLSGETISFKSVGTGDLSDDFNVKSFFRFDASLIEVIAPKVIASKGLIENKLVVRGEDGKVDYFFSSATDNFHLEYADAPGVFDKTKFLISFAKEKLNIEAFESDFGDGKLKIYGGVDLNPATHNVNLGFEINQTNFNFPNKIKLMVSGRGKVTGMETPYMLQGDFAVLDASIGAEIDEFKDTESDLATSKYLPESTGAGQRNMFDFDLSFETMNPIKITNSMSELSIWGVCKVKGTSGRPRYGGRLSMVPKLSKFFFKGNEFQIQKGEILFFENEGEINPELDIVAEANVSDYAIKMRVHGRSKSMKVDLASEPSLSNDSILSLLAFGFPSDMSKELQESDRSSLTSIGVGTLILDQLQISRSLKSALGVNLQVTSEFSENEKHLLDSRLKGDSASQSGSFKSATKIELRKQLSKSVNMSVSSTVGGSVGEKQEMNLNYNFNKVMSAEGIYEVRSSDGVEDEVEDTSAGVDLKFKWSTNW